MSIIQNEQTKLTATAMNNIVVATVVAGFLSPVVALGFGLEGFKANATAVVASVAWLLIGFILHLMARLALLRLKA